LNDGWHKRYDVALVFSQDTDLIEPIRIVVQELNLKVGVVWLDGRQPNRHLASAASFVRHIRTADLAASQFSNPLTLPSGQQLVKPQGW
jgi:hypothetical protein